MPRAMRIISRTLGGLVALLVLLIVVMTLMSWNWLRPTINDRVSDALGRPFAIEGDLGLSWQWDSWHLSPRVTAEDIVLGDPSELNQARSVEAGTEDARTARIGQVAVSLRPGALLQKRIALHDLVVRDASATLRRLDETHNNWQLADKDDDDGNAEQDQGNGWQFAIDQLDIDRVQVALNDRVLDVDATATLETLGEPVRWEEVAGDQNATNEGGKAASGQGAPNGEDRFRFAWQLEGTYRGSALDGDGRLGGPAALRDGGQFPLEVHLRSGNSRLDVIGTLNDPMQLAGLDLQVGVAGDNLGDLYDLTGVVLPQTPPYATRGHLLADLDTPEGGTFEYRDFDGTIGDSDIHGSLRYVNGAPRPVLTGELISKQLRLADLAPLVGADNEDTGDSVNPDQPEDKVLPVSEFNTDRWNTMDADVRFRAQNIVHGESLPLSDLSTHLVMDNGEILMDPLSFGVAGGHLNTTLRLSGQASPLRARIDMHARGLQLSQILPDDSDLTEGLGEINGDATLTGRGNSVAALLGSSDGELQLLIEQGRISRNLMELAGLNVGNYLIGELFGDEEVAIHCAAADLQFNDGMVRPRVFTIDTDNAIINVEGAVNLASEQMDLTIKPESKGFRIFTLRTPLYVSGTFKNPSPGVEAAPLIARGAAAIALGTLAAPAAALGALISTSAGEESQCGALIERMKSD
ncbi:AsmA family protein [uncultured Kushneria sp.]|uniref:AsmA family protein n=1 Tax=uncultured Kushneria sp. TaxID=905033 RepID=UPI002637482B|nr:AsmA family protein [uncultured Kushneria sp.]